MSANTLRRVTLALLGAGCAIMAGSAGAMAAGADANGASAAFVPGQIIVQYKTGPSSSARIGALATVPDARVVRPMLLPNTDLVRVTPGQEAAAIAALRKNPNVKSVELNGIVHATAMPDDPLLNLLWGLNNTGQFVNGVAGTPDADIDAPEAWNLGAHLTTKYIVAVTDTGITFGHPDLTGNIFINKGEFGGGKESNGIDDDGNGFVDDWHGWDFHNHDNDPTDDDFGVWHGTHVSGTIAGVSNNADGIAGVASFPTTAGTWAGPRILPIKVLDSSGSGTFADVIDGFMYAGKMGAKVVNVSLGGSGTNLLVDNAIAANSHTLFVVAAGNNGSNNDSSPFTPCVSSPGKVVPNKICVAATDSTDHLASFSNYGRTTVDLAAPGVNILSTMPPNGFQYLNGTSMATPHVAGAAIFLFAKFGGSTPLTVRDKLMRSVDKPAFLRKRVVSNGRLNLYKAGAESIVKKAGSSLQFLAGGGETNRVTVRLINVGGVDMYEFSDAWTGPGRPMQAGSRLVPKNGCVSVKDNTVRCPALGISRIIMAMGDLDDLVYGPKVPIPMIVSAGRGDDMIITGSGDDIVNGGPGYDSYYTGKGNDTINAVDGEVDHVFSCGENSGDKDVVNADIALDVVAADPANCEVVHPH